MTPHLFKTQKVGAPAGLARFARRMASQDPRRWGEKPLSALGKQLGNKWIPEEIQWNKRSFTKGDLWGTTGTFSRHFFCMVWGSPPQIIVFPRENLHLRWGGAAGLRSATWSPPGEPPTDPLSLFSP